MQPWIRALPAIAVIACSDASAPSDVLSLRFTALSAGGGHSCGRTTLGTTYCWGDNLAGQIGARTAERENPVPLQVVVRPLELTSVSAGSSFSCGLLNTGVPLCWGDGESSPRPLRADGRFVSVSAGEFICAVRDDGSTLCWDTPDTEPHPIQGPGFTQVSVGGLACGLASDATAWCWPKGSTVAQAVPDGLTFTAISAGSAHACGIRPDGAAYCWGQNGAGQLGNLSGGPASSPDTVSGGQTWTHISAGVLHTCGVATNGNAYCWGAAGSGQLGYDGAPPVGGSFNAPVRVRGSALPPNARWSAVSAGHRHSCGATVEGLTFCWGENTRGQLGDGTTQSSDAPVPIGPGQ